MFIVISNRYAQNSLIIHNNKERSVWTDILDEPVLTRAIVDWLLHKVSVFNIKGNSYG